MTDIDKDELERIVTTAQDIATMKRDIHHLTQGLHEQRLVIQAQTAQIKALTETLGKINTVLSEATGGWKTLMVAGAVGAGILGIIVKILEFFSKAKGAG